MGNKRPEMICTRDPIGHELSEIVGHNKAIELSRNYYESIIEGKDALIKRYKEARDMDTEIIKEKGGDFNGRFTKKSRYRNR